MSVHDVFVTKRENGRLVRRHTIFKVRYSDKRD